MRFDRIDLSMSTDSLVSTTMAQSSRERIMSGKPKQGYGTHSEYMARLESETKERERMILDSLGSAFSKFVARQEVDVIAFGDLSIGLLADAIAKFPAVLKPLLVACNVAGRAIERDLDIKNLDTYSPRITHGQATAIAQYLKPHLPSALSVPTLCYLDRTQFVDKEIRKHKGKWEGFVLKALTGLSGQPFRKRQFKVEGDSYEIDAASPTERDEPIHYAVDVKRIEGRRDIHKRSDEIVNKAHHFKQAFPSGRFGTVIYYPFEDEHTDIQDRLRSDNITAVAFASETERSIEDAVYRLLAAFELGRPT